MPNYAKMFTRRKDGCFQAKYKDAAGKWRTICAADPEKLYHRLQEKKNPPPLTVGDLLDAWQVEHDKETAFKTRESYIAPVRRLKEAFGDEPAANLSPARVQEFLADLGRKRYSRRSVQLHRSVMNLAYQRALLLGLVSINPIAVVSVPHNLPTSRREVPEDAALEAVRASQGVDFSAFALTLLYTGLRRGEALGLRYEDIDRKARIIHVRRSIEFTPNFPEVKLPKTNAGIRDVHFPPELLDVLPNNATGPIFPAPDGESYLSKEMFLWRWNKYCTAIGHKLTCHQLRHYYATAMFEAGVPVIAAQAQLGHKNASTTMNIYTHLREQKKEEAYSQIDAYFSGKSSDKE